jgi:flagellar hook assembly protein FlgD
MLIALTTVVLADEPRTSGVPISFSVEKPGQVSAGVYDSQGRLVRELLHAVPMAAGKQSVIWDGLDREGKSLPAGEYEWKALQTPGLKATF